jgi:hypothetical protein
MAHRSAAVPVIGWLKALAAVALVVWLVASSANAQKVALPDAPTATPAANVGSFSGLRPPQRELAAVPPHPFWDRTNKLLFAGIAVFRGLDYASTRNMQARGRKEILLAPEVVNNDAAFGGLEAAGTATSIALSYWLHRTGHHKLERWLSIGHIAVTGFGVARNYALKTKH